MASPNVLLICADHFPGPLLGAMGHERILTPTLNRLADNGVLREDSVRDIGALLDWIAEGRIKPHVSARFPLSDSVAAMRTLAERKAIGKVVITCR